MFGSIAPVGGRRDFRDSGSSGVGRGLQVHSPAACNDGDDITDECEPGSCCFMTGGFPRCFNSNKLSAKARGSTVSTAARGPYVTRTL